MAIFILGVNFSFQIHFRKRDEKNGDENGKTEKFKEEKSIDLLLNHPLKFKRLGIGVRKKKKKKKLR